MRDAAIQEVRQVAGRNAPDGPRSRLRRIGTTLGLNYAFWHLTYAPGLARWTKGIHIWFALRCSRGLRDAIAMNARRILGRTLNDAEAERFARGVASNFTDFLIDMAEALHTPMEKLVERVDGVEGMSHYESARAMKKGAIIATAHLGSFEAATAALLQREKKIHVVFKRDAVERFERIRAALRRHMCVIEAPIDEGWTLWMRLREALLADEVVMLQADRAMPGQKGIKCPFLHGHLLLPTGPIKLAMATGSPIVPVFAVRTPAGKIRIYIEEPIIVAEGEENIPAALQKIAKVLEKYISQYPEQWLVVQPAFCEDAEGAR